ncbi:MAG: hypothetical protein WKF73_15355 [Nocardioidaceae bacterium]
MPTAEAIKAEETLIHVLWINAGLSCDGDSVSLTAATQPSIEEIALGALPGLPKIAIHWPLIDFECGPNGGADDFLEWFFKADRGELEPFVLVVEGSIPNEKIKDEGYWCGFGNNPETGQPLTTSEWLDRLAPKATAIVAAGTCATYGGIHAMAGNPTGAMGLADYLGWDWKSKAGIPIVNVPGCPIQPDNLSETLTYLLYMATDQAPMIPLDEALRPTWLFGQTVHEGCDRAGYYEQGDFATEYGSPKCIVKLGCWGPVVKCNVPKRGWMNGMGVAPTWVVSASVARCRASRTSSCRSWTSRRAANCPRPPLEPMVRRSADCGPSPPGRSTRSPSGATPAASSPAVPVVPGNTLPRA